MELSNEMANHLPYVLTSNPTSCVYLRAVFMESQLDGTFPQAKPSTRSRNASSPSWLLALPSFKPCIYDSETSRTWPGTAESDEEEQLESRVITHHLVVGGSVAHVTLSSLCGRAAKDCAATASRNPAASQPLDSREV